ncbi:TPA: hypothetical protein QHN47_001632 [Klebsiella aerogenes]|uniref:hypothetical protein n=1 Tax=Enterobacteriaceae TaxID=543 RepID=UPI000E1FF464|nr:hypothetical protein [Escherichia coli]EKV8807339.1 hypothetical protein [Klebsiella aerogenes]EKX4702939.1 hypothetical protein [Klebsiella pneumoniae]ELJ2005385.1 hypothetical protein [Klebsiella aerogenes]HDS7214588.1 hypothetical protein [Klebsiella aerogenes]HDT4316663.1 hypothetical protein [Klebsiella aerogenes]
MIYQPGQAFSCLWLFFCMEHEAKKVADSGFLFTPQWQICQRNNNAIIGDDLNGDFKIMKLDDYPKTYNNVVKNSATANFDRKCQTFATLAQAVEPGSVVTSAGALYTSGDDAILCLSYADAGSNVPVIVADRLVYVYPEAIRAVMGSATNAALAALTANGNIRLTSDDVVIAE